MYGRIANVRYSIQDSNSLIYYYCLILRVLFNNLICYHLNIDLPNIILWLTQYFKLDYFQTNSLSTLYFCSFVYFPKEFKILYCPNLYLYCI